MTGRPSNSKRSIRGRTDAGRPIHLTSSAGNIGFIEYEELKLGGDYSLALFWQWKQDGPVWLPDR
jgi:hypothetical protein